MGPEGREQDQGYTEDSCREDVVHTRGLGARRPQDQERGQGRGWHGLRRHAVQEGQEGDGKVTCPTVIYCTLPPHYCNVGSSLFTSVVCWVQFGVFVHLNDVGPNIVESIIEFEFLWF